MTYSPLSTPFASNVNPHAALSLIVRAARAASNANQLVMARWTRNDGKAVLVGKEPVRLGALLAGEWTPNGFSLTEWRAL